MPTRVARESRLAEIDLLRIVAMIAVFAVHAAEPFNPWDEWHVRSPERSKWLGELVLFLAPWVMPLFILLAGASAWHSLEKRTARAYLHERVTRLIIPLVAGILLMAPPQAYFDRRQRGMFDGSFVEFYPHFFDGVYPTGNFAWFHLWFLAVLGVLALITLPLFRWLRSPRGRRVMQSVGQVCAAPGAILLLALPMIVVRVALWAAFPNGRPVVADWSNRTTLLAMFISGYAIAGEPRLMRAVDRQWRISLGVAVAFSLAMFAWAWPGDLTERFEVPFSARYVLFWSAYAVGGWAWSVALLGAARSLTRYPRGLVERGRWLLNPFYILHQTVIVAMTFYLVRDGVRPILTFGAVVVGSYAATLALCLVVVRFGVTRTLFGVRAAPRTRGWHLEPSAS